MNRLKNLLVICLCATVLGIFANFAQNDYGMTIIKYAMLVIYLCAATIAFAEIKSAKRVFAAVSATPLVFLTIYKIFDFQNEALFILILAGPPVQFILPVFLLILERKAAKKTDITNYFLYCLCMCISLGNYMKIEQLPGAGPVLASTVLSALTIGFISLFMFGKGLIKKQPNAAIGALYLFIIFAISTGQVFKTMHWPGASLSFVIATYLIVILIGLSLIPKGRRLMSECYKNSPFILKTLIICYTTIAFYAGLRSLGIGPVPYSNKNPVALTELINSSDGVTKQGIHFGEKADIYYSHYDVFLMELECKLENKSRTLDNSE